ncbi:hypothetical protein Y032_0041g345 [Ancylostoma ceylanicum]|uniref:Hemimethylated DNA-binding domain-containing protein n=1 Tax=Ancylostoma ceylanicum TaxID=53326 RepID=A0A016UGS9_9BILA|nr:hypothetical protein Y032_0041g345 [Ancylostoma ceylanicum]
MADLHPGLVFIILVFAVPLQFYLSPSSSSDIKYYLQKLTDSVIRTAEKIGIRLPFVHIRTGYQEKNAPASNDGDNDDAVVDEQERKDSSSYGNSLQVRERAPHVQWRVGQVVKHKVLIFRCTVIEELADKPNYAILIDVRDRLIPQLGYVVQDNIELHGGRIIHNLLSTYMERYDENDQKYVADSFFFSVNVVLMVDIVLWVHVAALGLKTSEIHQKKCNIHPGFTEYQ